VNFLYISPEFPPNYHQFIVHLNNLGIKVFGIGEADFYDMPEKLRSKISWYVKTDLRNWDSVTRALDHLVSQNPSLNKQRPFDVVESHNEMWLRLEGQINERYNLDGIRPQQLDRWKKKFEMKKVFQSNNILAAKGELVKDESQALSLAQQLKYPIILKPNEGVGSGGVHLVKNEEQLKQLLPQLTQEYLMEEFIKADIVTYDGLTDPQGQVIFENSLIYSEGILECVEGKDPSFYVNPNISLKLSQLGKKIAKLFNLKRKFFHFEFFKVGEEFMPIEINCRPPGGPILDMINYSAEDDLFYRYAAMIAKGETTFPQNKKLFCGYVGRRDRRYRHSHQEIVALYNQYLIEAFENMPLFWEAMGRYRYIFRANKLDTIRQITRDLLVA